MEIESSMECSVTFLWIVFRRIQPCFYKADRCAWLLLNQPRQRGFWRNLSYIPYSMVKELYLIKVSWTFSTHWNRRERKTTKWAFETDFLPSGQSIQLTWVDPRSSFCYANCFLGLTYGFLKKLSYLSVRLFIHNRDIFRNTSDGLLPFLELKLKCCFCTCSIDCYSLSYSLLPIQEFCSV